MVVDVGRWRGPDTETWVARIARPILRDGETLPLVKPLTAPAQEDAGAVGGGAAVIPGVRRPAALPSEGELREIYGK